jgi:hypothetical protein
MASLQRSNRKTWDANHPGGEHSPLQPRLALCQNCSSAGNFLAVLFAVVLVLAIGVVIVAFWTSLGDSDISPAGWIAMGFGVIIALALGIGLMALVFISSRRGYDELGRGSNAARPQNSDR